jgi:hypothetical protein
MSEPDRLDLDAIKQRARVRRRWPTGKIGNPQAWCRYCGALIPGEWAADYERVEHAEGCPVPGAKGQADNDVDALVAEVERLRGRLGH